MIHSYYTTGKVKKKLNVKIFFFIEKQLCKSLINITQLTLLVQNNS